MSKATAYNWRRLNTSGANRLTSRANKTASRRRITATSYLADDKATKLLAAVCDMQDNLSDIMYSLCVRALEQTSLLTKPHVSRFMESLHGYRKLDVSVESGTFRAGVDTLGYIYQSMLDEGRRNIVGVYYTASEITRYLTDGIALDAHSKLLDPCCGSGAFLMNVVTEHPECLYGFDIDPIAVMIASVNLLIRFPNHDFVPNVRKCDFLSKSLFSTFEEGTALFDYIYTNPPWGTDRTGEYSSWYSEILSHERASMTVLESLRRLKPGGKCCFVLPNSIVNIKAHSDIRRIITQQTTIESIHLLPSGFDGVFTDFFAIKLCNQVSDTQKYTVKSNTSDTSLQIVLSNRQRQTGEIPLRALSNVEDRILKKIEAKRYNDLGQSVWGLGIVTGDNKNKLHAAATDTNEPIYTGKQVAEFRLEEPKKFIRFNPAELQQCASVSIYRAPEKLIYRFIAKYPIVAYDDSGSLCLNSANVVIPQIEGISIKSVAAILNSAPYRFFYTTAFHDIKVLKSNLIRIPLPRISREQDAMLSSLTDRARRNGFAPELERELNDMVSSILGLSPEEQIVTEQYGNTK